ncbi:insulin-induced protein-domain-containing protein [Lipomyces tetrasporus]|uniref:Insulin-induced protein-domain-containing protein n=1 Tax=Lipomyces tetrasporus TaxID=54092 RepID=A0AAD7VVB4_9ASCO|nr:insulin-induced protein-domain-containing protein [Lipomyces tetrasporus]KAJ8102789.1 insulin-induced protein-domain-containing protein [Lipomyces tetrasporus]
MDSVTLAQPRPVRNFAAMPPYDQITDGSHSSSLYDDNNNHNNNDDDDDDGGAPHKSQSIVSLTSSALSGIFGSNLIDPSRAPTPDVLAPSISPASAILYGNDVARRRRNEGASQSMVNGSSRIKTANPKSGTLLYSPVSDATSDRALTSTASGRLSVLVKISLLFSFGVAYGHLVTQLQDNHYVTPTTLNIDPTGSFTLTWGVLGILLGTLLPFVDSISPAILGPKSSSSTGSSMFAWNTIVRAVGIFIGVSYGIRRLPWASTLQGALVLAFLNPILWFALDTSANGFILSSLTAILGTGVFAWAYPSHFPDAMGWTEDYISVATWIASIFFCSSICFGTIGRKLLGKALPDAAG